MISISIKSDFKEIQKKLNGLSLDVQKKVIPAALNKVAAKAKTEMSRAITSEFNIKADQVRSTLKIVNARRELKDWRAILTPFGSKRRKGASLNLIRFVERSVTLAEGRRRAKAGFQKQVYFQIKKSGGKKYLKDAFIATSRKTGGTAVFTRVGKSRYPIQAKQTIDIPQMFNTKRIQSRVDDRIRKDLVVEFERAVNAVFSGRIR